MAKRYDQLIPLIQRARPSLIVEVGVHRGIRAVAMCEAALYFGPVRYIGYDVFDTVDAEFQEAALNGKGPPSQTDATLRLDKIFGPFEHDFVVGDTRKTLHGRQVRAGFAFIDGDHRAEAIAGDYAALASSKCVVFDDYYRKDRAGRCPDLKEYGANQTVDRLLKEGRKVSVLPMGDTCKHGGVSHLAVVWR